MPKVSRDMGMTLRCKFSTSAFRLLVLLQGFERSGFRGLGFRV